MVFTLHWSSSLGLSSFLARALRSSRAAVRGVLSAASRNWSTWLSRWVATESGHGCWSILSLEANFIASTPHSYAYIKQARCSLIIITEAAATTQHPAECEREKVKIIYIPASLAPFYSQKTLVSPPIKSQDRPCMIYGSDLLYNNNNGTKSRSFPILFKVLREFVLSILFSHGAIFIFYIFLIVDSVVIC